MAFVAPFITQLDQGDAIVLLGGVHVGCVELVGGERVRAIRANLCSTEPARAARMVAARGYTYEDALQTMQEISYGRWREYDAEDTVRFYALRLREAGLTKSSPQTIIARATDWRFFKELKKELKA
jgi:hypothetical protein